MVFEVLRNELRNFVAIQRSHKTSRVSFVRAAFGILIRAKSLLHFVVHNFSSSHSTLHSPLYHAAVIYLYTPRS